MSLENGLVVNFDARTLPSDLNSPSPARFTVSAHDGAVSALDINPHVRGVIATGGTDKIVKVWNIAEDQDTGKRQVSLVTSRELGVVRRFMCFVGVSGSINIGIIGQGLHDSVVPGRPSHTRSCRVKGKTASLGHRRERRCTQGPWTQSRRGGQGAQGEAERRRHRCRERRRGQQRY